MFDYIRVSNIKGLKECELIELGRINIICGKNNSGKSTLLEGINNRNHRTIGKVFSTEDVTQLYENTRRSAIGWPEDQEDLNKRYYDVLSKTAFNQKWYANEAEEFSKQLVQNFRSNVMLRQRELKQNVVQNFYRDLFPSNLTTLLVPPKRHLELSANIDGNQSIEQDGTGILNYLFCATNQSEASEDKVIYRKISEAFSEISSGYKFAIFMEKGKTIHLHFSYTGSDWVLAKDCGLGLQDLLTIIYFAIQPLYPVVLIEEIESHMHPDMQRRLLVFLQSKTDKQFFLSTHSNVYLSNLLVDKIFFTRFTSQVRIDDMTAKATILSDLGYSVTDNLVSDLIVIVEGPTDIPVIDEFLKKLGLIGPYDIKVWPIGGDIMDQIDLSILLQNRSVIALIDNDPGSRRIRDRFIKNCEALDIRVHKLKRRSIENYFTLEALKQVFHSQIPVSITSIDPKIKLEEQIGINVKKNNRKIAEHMSVADIQGTDLELFFRQVKDICIQPTVK